jgi:benzoate-CoA ligase
MSVGATVVLMAGRPTPAAVFKRLREYKATIFYGVPTLYAGLLAGPEAPAREELALRRCVCAGEALPEELGKRWTQRYGVDILDGIGSTEMLHIFLSNRPGDVRYGTTGKPVPGYELRVVDEHGAEVKRGEVGELQVNGPTAAALYWNNREKTRATFQGPWTRSGDKYSQTEDGYYVYAGRSDDMLKVSGIYVSPVEVEAALIAHASVLEAAVIGRADDDNLVKPCAYVVLKPGVARSDGLMNELRQLVKSQPKTATGKIQRFMLRAEAARH